MKNFVQLIGSSDYLERFVAIPETHQLIFLSVVRNDLSSKKMVQGSMVIQLVLIASNMAGNFGEFYCSLVDVSFPIQVKVF